MKRHPKLEEANNLIERANRLRKEVDDEERENLETLRPIYKTTVLSHKQEKESWLDYIPQGTEVLVIRKTLTNNEVFSKHIQYYDRLPNTPKRERVSEAYYRVNKVLIGTHNGWKALRKYRICSDEEWEDLKEGKIPDRLDNNKYAKEMRGDNL